MAASESMWWIQNTAQVIQGAVCNFTAINHGHTSLRRQCNYHKQTRPSLRRLAASSGFNTAVYILCPWVAFQRKICRNALQHRGILLWGIIWAIQVCAMAKYHQKTSLTTEGKKSQETIDPSLKGIPHIAITFFIQAVCSVYQYTLNNSIFSQTALMGLPGNLIWIWRNISANNTTGRKHGHGAINDLSHGLVCLFYT